MCSPIKGFPLTVPLKATRGKQRFRFRLRGVQFVSAHSGDFWKRYCLVLMTPEKFGAIYFAVWCIPRSFSKKFEYISQRNRKRIWKYCSLYSGRLPWRTNLQVWHLIKGINHTMNTNAASSCMNMLELCSSECSLCKEANNIRIFHTTLTKWGSARTSLVRVD